MGVRNQNVILGVKYPFKPVFFHRPGCLFLSVNLATLPGTEQSSPGAIGWQVFLPAAPGPQGGLEGPPAIEHAYATARTPKSQLTDRPTLQYTTYHQVQSLE